MVYKATNNPIIISDPTTAKPVDVLNMVASISRPFGFTPLRYSMVLIIYIPIKQSTNTIAIRSKMVSQIISFILCLIYYCGELSFVVLIFEQPFLVLYHAEACQAFRIQP